MSNQVSLENYMNFVERVTSEESNDVSNFVRRVKNVSNGSEVSVNIPLLLTAAIGMSAECGEFAELPKKVMFQGKPMDEDTRYHMMRELGDVMWYWINACRALGLDPNQVIAENVKKLEDRYPGGEFDVFYSENRVEGDL